MSPSSGCGHCSANAVPLVKPFPFCLHSQPGRRQPLQILVNGDRPDRERRLLFLGRRQFPAPSHRVQKLTDESHRIDLVVMLARGKASNSARNAGYQCASVGTMSPWGAMRPRMDWARTALSKRVVASFLSLPTFTHDDTRFTVLRTLRPRPTPALVRAAISA
jgi:hypothetical protein